MYTGNRTPSPFPSSQAADRALLLATLPSLDPPHFLAPVIAAAAATTRRHITIALFSRLFNDPASAAFRGVSRTERFDDVARLLTYVYTQATSVAQSQDKVLIHIDVLLLGVDADLPSALGTGLDVVYRVPGDAIAVPLPACISSVRQSYLPAADHDRLDAPVPTPPTSPATVLASLRKPPRLPVVALGGTFDHLHPGHKILLSMGAWLAADKIIVGITDDALLTRKTHPDLVQPLDERIAHVRTFLALFRPAIEYQVVPITDVYGPTGWDPHVQGLVVSRETQSGADAIASHRLAKDLPPLETFVIDVISPHEPRLDHDDMDLLRRTKMSSTFIRQWIAENRTKEVDTAL